MESDIYAQCDRDLTLSAELGRMKALFEKLLSLLERNGHIDAADLAAITEKARTGRDDGRLPND